MRSIVIICLNKRGDMWCYLSITSAGLYQLCIILGRALLTLAVGASKSTMSLKPEIQNFTRGSVGSNQDKKNKNSQLFDQLDALFSGVK